MEHEADLIGLVLTLQAMASSGYDAALAYVGVDLFFVSLEFAERARHIVKYGTDDGYADISSDTHPSGSARRAFLREALSTFIEDAQQVANARSAAAQYCEIAHILWTATKASNPRLRKPSIG